MMLHTVTWIEHCMHTGAGIEGVVEPTVQVGAWRPGQRSRWHEAGQESAGK